jgi:hypothetical protein
MHDLLTELNDVNGPIPTEIGLLTSLTNLDLGKLVYRKVALNTTFACFVTISC